jgi:hypothetical protein
MWSNSNSKGSEQDLDMIWIFSSIKPWGGLNNSQKISIEVIFMNVNLDDLTCMQKFEDPMQVAFGLDLMIKENLNMNFELGLHCSYTVVAL